MPAKTMKPRFALIAIFVCALTITIPLSRPRAESIEVDPDIPAYTPVSGLSGHLQSVGSDTLNEVMALWVADFKALNPAVDIQFEGKGSATGPPALVQGVCQLAPMSRQMSEDEVQSFHATFGYNPVAYKVAIDGLAVFTNKDNPVKGLTLDQVDGIFSATPRRGSKSIEQWGGVGLTGDWAGKPIELYGRNEESGTYAFFKEHVLKDGDYKAGLKKQKDSEEIVQEIIEHPLAMGYSGIGFKKAGVNALSIGATPDMLAAPTYLNCLTGAYPIARFLYIYVNKKPSEPVSILTAEFLRFIFSRAGQTDVVKAGFFPLPAQLVLETREDTD